MDKSSKFESSRETRWNGPLGNSTTANVTSTHDRAPWRNCPGSPLPPILRCKLCFSGGYGISLPCCRICELPNLQKKAGTRWTKCPSLYWWWMRKCIGGNTSKKCKALDGQCSDQLPLLDPELGTSERIHPPSARSQRCLHLRNHIFPHFQPSQCFLRSSARAMSRCRSFTISWSLAGWEAFFSTISQLPLPPSHHAFDIGPGPSPHWQMWLRSRYQPKIEQTLALLSPQTLLPKLAIRTSLICGHFSNFQSLPVAS